MLNTSTAYVRRNLCIHSIQITFLLILYIAKNLFANDYFSLYSNDSKIFDFFCRMQSCWWRNWATMKFHLLIARSTISIRNRRPLPSITFLTDRAPAATWLVALRQSVFPPRTARKRTDQRNSCGACSTGALVAVLPMLPAETRYHSEPRKSRDTDLARVPR